jgi:putative addiction module component (TIGR02574 family)
MTALAQSLMTLPFEEKVQLVFDLWDSIHMEKSKIPVPEADLAEMERRLDEYLKDGDKGETWEVVRASISKKL